VSELKPRRHLIIPDAQIKAGSRTEHVKWAAKAIVEYLPDVIVVIGDWWDLSSLSGHEEPGSIHMEGSRLKDDIEEGNRAFEDLVVPMNAERERRVAGKRKQWNPECHFLFGNHEHRLARLVNSTPKFDGLLTMDLMRTPGFQRHPFLKIVEIDGIKYCHYFPNPFSGKPIGGTIVNRLNHIGSTFVQGHQQGFMSASKQYPDHVKHGIVCGRFYLDHEHYRPEDVQRSEWSGIVVLNQVRNGDFDLMSLRMDYLQRKYS
jgi:hypothetical protein